MFGPTGVSVEVWLTLGWLKGAPGRCETLETPKGRLPLPRHLVFQAPRRAFERRRTRSGTFRGSLATLVVPSDPQWTQLSRKSSPGPTSRHIRARRVVYTHRAVQTINGIVPYNAPQEAEPHDHVAATVELKPRQ